MGRSKKGTVSVSTGPGTHAFIRFCGWNVSGVPELRLVWPIQTKDWRFGSSQGVISKVHRRGRS